MPEPDIAANIHTYVAPGPSQGRSDACPHVVIVGGGISGLSAAWALVQRSRHENGPLLRVTVVEASERFGGKLQTTPFAGLPVDTGADAFLARVPDGVALCRELGIDDELVSPLCRQAWLWSGATLRHFPSDTLLGVPSSVRCALRGGITRPRDVLQLVADYVLRASGNGDDDVSIAQLVGARVGSAVVEQFVDPLLGGINAGSVQRLSARSAAPQLTDIAGHDRSLLRAVRGYLNDRQALTLAPMFYAPKGGMARLSDALVNHLTDAGVTLRTGQPVCELIETPRTDSWRIETDDHAIEDADGVILATPASVTAKLLATICPEASITLAEIRYASVAVVRLAYPKNAIAHHLNGSGFVVPSSDGRLVTACSWASSKWAELEHRDQVILRASAGRMDDVRAQSLSDEELTDAIHSELSDALGIAGGPIEVDITRWDGAFPQYEVGHGRRVHTINQAVGKVPGLALAGAAYNGLGVPACIRSGTAAAEAVLRQITTRPLTQIH